MITESRFLTPLRLESIEDKEGAWWLLYPLVYQSVLLQRIFTVPCGTYTDLASVPRIPIIYSLWGNRAHHEAVLHDFGFRVGSGLTFMEANRLFLEAMHVRNKPGYIRYPMFWAVCSPIALMSYNSRDIGYNLKQPPFPKSLP